MVRLVSSRDMPAVGSSRRSSRGFWTRHMASSSRRLSPRERLPASWRSLSPSPTSTTAASALSRRSCSRTMPRQASMAKAPSRLASAGITTFSWTGRSGKISGVWKTRDTPSWLIS